MPDRVTVPGPSSFEGGPFFVQKPRLSKRQCEVLSLVGHGWSDEEIAQQLFLSVWTVRDYLRQATVQLDARNRTHAAMKALFLGLIEFDTVTVN